MGDQNQSHDEGKLQSQGRNDNAAQPLNTAGDAGAPERYPQVRQDDAVEPSHPEPRTFGGETQRKDPVENPRPEAVVHDRMGPAGDPAEGKR